jgi:enoyl-CoA hydratase/carnithine racemase
VPDEVLLSERVAPKVHLLTLNRPDRLNTMTAALCDALHGKLAMLAADRSCRAIVITGAGRGFCAGLDLQGYGEGPGTDGTDPSRDSLANQTHMSRLILRLRSTPQPVIAAVNGPAAGFGLALALGSDIRYAARSAVFRVIFVKRRGVELRYGRQLALAAADRSLPLARADAHRAARRCRRG